MFSSRQAASRFICSACRQAARPKPTLSATIARPTVLTQISTHSRQTFSSNVRHSREASELSTQGPEYAFLDDSVTPQLTPVSEATPPLTDPPRSSNSESSIPWYLRQQASLTQTQKPAEIPALPLNPPPLLQTILEYISVTAGLDDLELLDLRDLDPPPALGPKLIMIIGTARSEKHLHVAADRFARYLRREHGLKANAAGLLGRNELKIKLRRKAKRMRMLANVGGTVPEGNIDDGIRTGWICCTLSKIEAHSDDTHMPGDNVKEFIGFRDVKPGVNVVVQMFTEEKRAETDLETLWGGVLRTHQRNTTAAEEKLRDKEDDQGEVAQSQPPVPVDANSSQAVSPDPIPQVLQYRRPKPTPGDVFPSESAFEDKPRRTYSST